MAVPSDLDFDWNVTRDIEALHPDNELPTGIWSDGETLWVLENAASGADRVFAYDLVTGERTPEAEFELERRNRFAHGIWSDGELVWVADSGQDLLFAYRLATGERLEGPRYRIRRTQPRPARNLVRRAHDLRRRQRRGRAVRLPARDRRAARRLFARQAQPEPFAGIWSDGLTLWVSDDGAKRIFAYRIENETLNRYEDEGVHIPLAAEGRATAMRAASGRTAT